MAHECLILLLNKWASLGNLLLARNALLKFSPEAVQAADVRKMLPEHKFNSARWASDTQTDEESPAGGFEPIRKQYERLLGSLPENYHAQWKEEVEISDADVKMEDADAKKEERSEAGAEVKKEEPTEKDEKAAAVKKKES